MSELRFTTVRHGARHADGVVLLQVQNLTVKVGIRRVLQNVNLAVFEGDMIRVSGPNGCGKSTLLNAIAGLDPARIESGSVSLDGEDVTNLPPHERSRRGLAIVRQRDNVFADLTVEENLRLAAGTDARRRLSTIYPDWGAGLPGGRRAGLLSGGQKQRLAWAMSTLRTSRILLADEPEVGVSGGIPLPAGTIVLVSHTFNEATGELK